MTVADSSRQTFSTTMPLATKLQRALVFSHAVSDDAYFTELAVVNPGAAEALAPVDLHRADGSRLRPWRR